MRRNQRTMLCLSGLMLLLLISGCAASAVSEQPTASSTVQPAPSMGATESPNEFFTTPVPSTPVNNEPTHAVPMDNLALSRLLHEQIEGGAAVISIDAPQIPLPEQVQLEQIKHYFQVGNIVLGLVLQPSSNVFLNITQRPAFTGLLISSDGKSWRQYIRIEDQDATNKHNPYYFWAQEGQLYLSIVDQNGAGSGEGNMQLLQLAATGTWEMIGCYYFGANYSDPTRDGDYFAFSQYLEKQQTQAAERCVADVVVFLP
jgi:hypothetical protein